MSEHVLGRAARINPVDAFKRLSSSKFPWGIVGVIGVSGAFLILAFYTEVAGWVLAYIPRAITGSILTTDPATAGETFTALITNPIGSLFWQWVDLLIVGAIILFGISKGIEAATKRLIPLLLVLLIIVAVRSLTLPGAEAGLEFLLKPDFSKLTPAVILTAMGLAFFKLSVGMGVMMTYGSYYPDEQNILSNGFKVALSDVAIALLAGVAIFPAVFALGFEPNSGPALLFITIPAVFASMPLGRVFIIIFFVLAFIASIGAQVSLVEAVVTFLQERLNWDRRKTTIISIISLAIFGALAALSNSTLADVKVFGKTFFDFFDHVSSNIMLPAGGLLISIFIGWIWGKDKFVNAMTNNGKLNNQGTVTVLFNVLRWLTPVLITIVFLSSLKIIG